MIILVSISKTTILSTSCMLMQRNLLICFKVIGIDIDCVRVTLTFCKLGVLRLNDDRNRRHRSLIVGAARCTTGQRQTIGINQVLVGLASQLHVSVVAAWSGRSVVVLTVVGRGYRHRFVSWLKLRCLVVNLLT